MTGLRSHRIDCASNQLKCIHGCIATGAGKTKRISGSFVRFAFFQVEIFPLIAFALDAIRFLGGYDPAEKMTR